MQVKVGILYVGKGQEIEKEIFLNNGGSSDYEEFLLSLGWEIDLSKHSGYRGRIEPSWGNMKTHYYCNSTYEVLYHVATKMIDEQEQDPSQLFLKRVNFFFIFSSSIFNSYFFQKKKRKNTLEMMKFKLFGMIIIVLFLLI